VRGGPFRNVIEKPRHVCNCPPKRFFGVLDFSLVAWEKRVECFISRGVSLVEALFSPMLQLAGCFFRTCALVAAFLPCGIKLGYNGLEGGVFGEALLAGYWDHPLRCTVLIDLW